MSGLFRTFSDENSRKNVDVFQMFTVEISFIILLLQSHQSQHAQGRLSPSAVVQRTAARGAFGRAEMMNQSVFRFPHRTRQNRSLICSCKPSPVKKLLLMLFSTFSPEY